MTEPTILLLAGSRALTEPGIVPATLADIAFNIAVGPITIRHGACPGKTSADQAASDWITSIGHRYGVTEDPMPADWDNCAPNCPTTPGHRKAKKPGDTAHPGLLDDYCPSAGPRRNKAMTLKQPRPAWMVAFPEPGQPSYGTRNCVRLAEQAGIRVRTITA
ncbi:hypothetical protein [Streptomyces sp. NPDC005732]|uniref:hypothetical protein n=1 Tax=Streptomyces sp. NPDC005732 TaxID=3157057 RepID=UPI0033EB3058